ncbi:MAG TPA: ABC transporter ATP-binding protein [Thermoanaerobaculia bacterium]|nr:ABC transporter ATP-binding protein [Thermoanaerobaculia bacterium]
MADEVLVAEHLTKRFGDREAVSDVSFTLHAGEVLGFLGPNGAGKTTTIRMLVGLARPDGGRIRIRGLDLATHFREAMVHVGSIVEAPDLYKYLTGRENLTHFARMLPKGAEDRIEALAAMVQMRERLDDRVATYSLGMRQRLGIAQALLGNPDVLILDEPANGLDPAGIREMRELVRRLAGDRGISVFVSSHLLSEVELMCDRVAIIHRGRTLASGPVRELLERFEGDRLLVRARPAAAAAERLVAFGASDVETSAAGDLVSARVDAARVPDALRDLVGAGVDVYSVERPDSSLEDAFLQITGGETV